MWLLDGRLHPHTFPCCHNHPLCLQTEFVCLGGIREMHQTLRYLALAPRFHAAPMAASHRNTNNSLALSQMKLSFFFPCFPFSCCVIAKLGLMLGS